MKVRTGFVSNSSSSSFCIIGYETSIKELIEKFNIEDENGREDYDYDKITKVTNEIESNSDFNVIIDCEDPESSYIGFGVLNFNIGEILELGCQPSNDDKISLLKKKMQRLKEPTIIAGEFNY